MLARMDGWSCNYYASYFGDIRMLYRAMGRLVQKVYII